MKTRWKVIAIVVLVLAAYAFGRYMTPAKVVEKVKIERVVDTKYVIVEKAVEVKATTADTKRNTRTIKKETTAPDGTTVRIEISEELEDKREFTEEERVVEAAAEIVTKETESIQKEKVVEFLKAQWRIGPMLGVSSNKLSIAPSDLVYGAHVERRVLGPIWFGAWGIGATHLPLIAGLSASLEF